MTSLHAWSSARCICMLVAMIVQNFGTKFLLRRGKCKTRENSNFLKKGKIVILVIIRNGSRMTKRIPPLESSREI